MHIAYGSINITLYFVPSDCKIICISEMQSMLFTTLGIQYIWILYVHYMYIQSVSFIFLKNFDFWLDVLDGDMENIKEQDKMKKKIIPYNTIRPTQQNFRLDVAWTNSWLDATCTRENAL
jgi:hypothetical protein